METPHARATCGGAGSNSSYLFPQTKQWARRAGEQASRCQILGDYIQGTCTGNTVGVDRTLLLRLRTVADAVALGNNKERGRQDPDEYQQIIGQAGGRVGLTGQAKPAKQEPDNALEHSVTMDIHVCSKQQQTP